MLRCLFDKSSHVGHDISHPRRCSLFDKSSIFPRWANHVEHDFAQLHPHLCVCVSKRERER
eukprot:c16448_g1_i1 orf=215-397(+)